MVGLSYWVTPHVSANLRYAIMVAQDPSFQDDAGDKFKLEYQTRGLMAGLVYKF